MKKTILTLSTIAALAASATVRAAVPAGYYNSLEGKSGVELKKAVKDLIADHVVIPYGEADPNNPFNPVDVATWTVFAESDVRTVNDHLCWWDMYSANNIWVSDGHPGLNIEHSVANSWWGGKSGSQSAYNDLHHLNPSNGDANGQKSNWPLGIIQGNPYWTNGVTTTGTPAAGYGGGATRVFQPYESYRGDFARAYFYIFTIYDDIPWKDDYAWMYNTMSNLTLKEWAYNMLLEWNSADPVSQKETSRNDVVYTYQENRNPFIDCPQLADHIWGSKQNEPFHYELYTPAEDDPADYPGYDEIFPEMISGRWIPVASNEDLDEEQTYFIVTPTKNRAMTYSLISTGKAIDECTYSPVLDENVTPAALTSVPEQIATVKLERGDGGWYVGLYDSDENFKGYINVSSKNTATLSQTPAKSCLAQIEVDGKANKTVITYTLSDGAYTLQYNSGNPRFAAYTSNQNPIQLYVATDPVTVDPDDPDAGVGATGLDDNAGEIIIGIFDVNGRKVNATSTSQLENGIYIVVTNHGTRKIRK